MKQVSLKVVVAMFGLTFVQAIAGGAEIASVKASSHAEGLFGPENVIDSDMESRWSAKGEGEWIVCTLKEPAEIDAVGIAWLHGDQRKTEIAVQVSTDGDDWQEVGRGKSGGVPQWLDVISFEPVRARYVRVLCYGNEHNDWNSIVELRVGMADALKKLQRPTVRIPKLDIRQVPIDAYKPQYIIDLMKKVNEYTVKNPYTADDSNWIRATWYTGVMGLYRATQDPQYLKQARNWAEKHEWEPGDHDTAVNKLTIGQTYLELYDYEKNPETLEKIRAYADKWMIGQPEQISAYWHYCDTLYVGPPTLAMLGEVTGEQKYYDYMHKAWWDTYDRLYSKETDLFYRDAGYIGKQTVNGKPIFWSRGNGWVLAGLPRILQHLPKDDPHYAKYVDVYKKMSTSIARRQGADGLWRSNLTDIAEFPAPESSGTAFFCYAMAWGINNDILDKKEFLPVVMKAWKGLVAAVQPDGKFGWVQNVAAAPGVAARDMTHEYAVGLFLLAGEEMVKLSDDVFTVARDQLRPPVEVDFSQQPPAAGPLVVKVADSVLERFKKAPNFDWGEGVLLTGMVDAYQMTGDQRYLDWLKMFADYWSERGIEQNLAVYGTGPKQIEAYCGVWGPGYAMVELYEITGEQVYLDVAETIARFMLDEAPKTAEGSLVHFRKDTCIWCDTLWMACPVFTELAAVADKPAYQAEAVKQLSLAVKHVQNPQAHLFYHNWNETNDKTNGLFWARGNGWIVLSFIETLRREPKESEHYSLLINAFQKQIDAIVKLQDQKTGLWHTVLDKPETYVETSASAMFLYAMLEGQRLGLLEPIDPQITRRAWQALATQIDERGRVIGVSGGTGPSANLTYYANIPTGTRTWGTGAWLMAARVWSETDRAE